MKLLLIAAFIYVASAIPTDEWSQYKAEHKKVYTSEEENMRRLEEYLKSKEMVEEHNRKYERGETTYTMAINQFSDWFPEELHKLNGLKLQKSGHPQGEPFELPAGTHVPESINWVKKGAVTSVKNQERCGSCYAFGAIGALEGLMFRTNNTITDLSAQEIVDCSDNLGCNGGLPDVVFAYVKARDGIDTEKSYPYVGYEEYCRADNGTIGATCNGYVKMVGEYNLQNAVGTVGPVSVAFGVDDSFFHYESGVFDGTCAFSVNHAMLAVGYGRDKTTNKDYWLVKNSWGIKWGEKGYARILRNVNKCGIGEFLCYPTYKKPFN